MRNLRSSSNLWKIFVPWLVLLAGIFACSRGDSQVARVTSDSPQPTVASTHTPEPSRTPTATPTQDPPTATLDPVPPRYSPTPDDVRPAPEFRDNSETHVVRVGDTLNYLAHRYGVAMGQIQVANGLLDPNLLGIGQILLIPPPTPEAPGSSYKIIPDSELVYGPSAVETDSIFGVISSDSSLANYYEEVDHEMMTGLEILQMTVENYSVNPRLLLAILEFQSRWVRGDSVDIGYDLFPIGWYDEDRIGLASQLYWAADQLNAGFYRWRAGWARSLYFS